MRRLPWLILPAGSIFLSVIAYLLTPDPSGIGTHRHLGLPACPFYTLTGLICPACGLTTSLAYLLKGQVDFALGAHPLGPLLYLLLLLASVFSLLEFFGKRTYFHRFFKGDPNGWAYGGIAVFLGVWLARLIWQLPAIKK